MTDDRKRLGGSNGCHIESYRPRVAEINAVEKDHEALSDAALRARSEEFKTRIAGNRPIGQTAIRTPGHEQSRRNLAAGVRARLKSASLAARPPAKGSEG